MTPCKGIPPSTFVRKQTGQALRDDLPGVRDELAYDLTRRHDLADWADALTR